MIKKNTKSRIGSVARHESNISQLLHASKSGDSDVSHAVFEISPSDKRRFLSACKFGAVSKWALKFLFKVYETQQADAITTFYQQISGMPSAASLRGHVFELQALHYLDDLRTKREFSIRGLTSTTMTWIYHGRTRRFNSPQDLDSIKEITQAVEQKTPLHLVPGANFPAVDSILYDPGEVLTCIQTTISGKHDIRVSGLRRIQSWLRGEPLAALRPSKNRPWRFIFIVPPSVEESFKSQRLEGDTARGEWAGKVQQYVLGLDILGKNAK